MFYIRWSSSERLQNDCLGSYCVLLRTAATFSADLAFHRHMLLVDLGWTWLLWLRAWWHKISQVVFYIRWSSSDRLEIDCLGSYCILLRTAAMFTADLAFPRHAIVGLSFTDAVGLNWSTILRIVFLAEQNGLSAQYTHFDKNNFIICAYCCLLYSPTVIWQNGLYELRLF